MTRVLVSLTPAHPPPSIIQRTQAVGGQDLPHRVVRALFGRLAPQALHQKRGSPRVHAHGKRLASLHRPELTVTFCRQTEQLVLDLCAQEATTDTRTDFLGREAAIRAEAVTFWRGGEDSGSSS